MFKMFKLEPMPGTAAVINVYHQLCIRGDNIWLEIAECVKKTLLAIGPKMQVPASATLAC